MYDVGWYKGPQEDTILLCPSLESSLVLLKFFTSRGVLDFWHVCFISAAISAVFLTFLLFINIWKVEKTVIDLLVWY